MLSQNDQKSKTRLNIDDAVIDRVLICLDAGMGASEIVNVTGVPTATVQRIIRAAKTVRNENWDGAVELLVKSVPAKYLERAAKRYEVKIPDKVYWKAEGIDTDTPSAMVTTSAAVEPITVKVPEKQNEDLYFCKLLEAIAKQNELIEQLMDVVIPKYIGDLKDNLNANTDLLSERLKNCESRLEKIAVNTRKRGA